MMCFVCVTFKNICRINHVEMYLLRWVAANACTWSWKYRAALRTHFITIVEIYPLNRRYQKQRMSSLHCLGSTPSPVLIPPFQRSLDKSFLSSSAQVLLWSGLSLHPGRLASTQTMWPPPLQPASVTWSPCRCWLASVRACIRSSVSGRLSLLAELFESIAVIRYVLSVHFVIQVQADIWVGILKFLASHTF